MEVLPADLQPLGDACAGQDHAHLALLYESRDELFATALPFLRAGLERGERCMYVTAETPKAALEDAMTSADYDFETALDAGALSLHSEEAYLDDGAFDPEAMIDFLEDRTAEVTAEEGYEGLRIAGEATWALDDEQRIDGLLTYEDAINDFFATNDCIATCIYDRKQFPADVLEDVIRTHPQLVYDGTVMQNVYYVPPAERSGGTDSVQTVERQLQTLIEHTHELHESRELLAGQRHALELLAKGTGLNDVLDALIHAIENYTSGVRGSILVREPNEERFGLVAAPNLPQSFTEILHRAPFTPPYLGPCGKATDVGETVVCDDVETDTRWASAWRDLVLDDDLHSCHSTPITGSDDEVLGSLGLYSSQSGDVLPDQEILDTISDIAGVAIQRKETEAERRESEERLRLATDAAEMGVWELALRTSESPFRSPRHDEIFGYGEPLDDWSVETFLDHVHPDDRGRVEESFEEALQTGDWAFDCQIIRADDEQRWITAQGEFYYDSNGEPVRAVGTVKDVTEQKEREQYLRDAKSRLEAAAQAGAVGTWEWHIPEDSFVAGPTFAEKFDVDPVAAAEGVPIDQFIATIYEDDRERVEREIEDAIESGDEYEEEYRVWNADEELRWVVARGHVVCDDGNPVAFPGALIDITERKETEADLRELNAELEQQSRVFDTTLSAINDFAYTFDEEGRFVYVNDALLDLWGMELEEAVGKTFLELPYPDDLAETLHEQIQQVFETGEDLTDETPYYSPTGDGRYYEYIFVPVFDEDSEVELVAGSTRDITERKRREERQEFLFRFSDGLRAQPDEQSIKDQAVTMLAEHLNLDRCWISEVFEQQGISTVGPEQIRPDLPPMSGVFQLSEYPETMRQLATQPMDIQDAANDSRFSDSEKEQLAGFDLRALLVVPLRKGERDVIWALSATMASPRQWTNGEQALLEEAAERTWAAVERARAKEEIRESERKMQLALDAAEMATWNGDPRTSDLTADEQFYRIFHDSPEPLTYEQAFDHVHPDDRQRIRDFVEAAARSDDPVQYAEEYRVVHPDGTVRWVFAKGRTSFVTTEAGRRLESFDGTLQDITERKEREQTLVRQREQIEQLQNMFLETSPTGIFVVDSAGEITLANDRAEEILGMPSEELIGLSHDASEFGLVDSNEESLPDEEHPFERVTDAGEAIFGMEVGFERPDGQRIWVSVNAAPLYDDADEPTQVVVAIEDITERKRTTEALDHLNTASQELMNADVGVIYERAAALTQHVLDVEYAAVWSHDAAEDSLGMQASSTALGIDAETIRLPDVFEENARQTFTSKELMVSNDLPPAPDVAAPEHLIRSGLILPLGTHGVACAGSIYPDEMDTTTVDLAGTIATNVESALNRAEREELLENQNEELQRLDRLNGIIRAIDRSLVQADTRAEVERIICERLADSDLYEFAWFGEYDAATRTVEPNEWAGVDSSYLEDLTITVDDTGTGYDPIGTAVRTSDTQVVSDIATDARFVPWREQTLEQGARSCIVIPLVYNDSLYGVLSIYAETTNIAEKNLTVLNEFGETIAHALNAIETKELLHTNSVIELTLQIQESDSVLARLAQQIGSRIEFEGHVQANRSLCAFITVHGAPPEAIRAAGERIDGLDELVCITERDETSVFKVVASGPAVSSLLVEQGAVVRTLTFEGRDTTAAIDLPSDTDVRGFIETLQTTYPELALRARRTRDRPIKSPQDIKTAFEDQLTDRQQETLRTAYLSGYFQSPRETMGTELADLLGISQPTFTQHLRAGQSNFFELVFDTS